MGAGNGMQGCRIRGEGYTGTDYGVQDPGAGSGVKDTRVQNMGCRIRVQDPGCRIRGKGYTSTEYEVQDTE